MARDDARLRRPPLRAIRRGGTQSRGDRDLHRRLVSLFFMVISRAFSTALSRPQRTSRIGIRTEIHSKGSPLVAQWLLCNSGNQEPQVQVRSHVSPDTVPHAYFSLPGSSLDREAEGEGGLLLSIPPVSEPSAQQNRYTAPPSFTSQRTRLPISKHREKLLYCVEKYGVVIVVGQTGCGKSTRE